MKKHKHHIVPRHRGGTDADGLVEVSVGCHAIFHYCEWRLWGHTEDYIAWKCLSGQMNGKEISEEVERMRVEKIAKAHRGTKRSEETRRRISEAKKGTPSPNKGKKMSEEQKAKMSATRKRLYGKTEEEKKAREKAYKATREYKDRKNARARELYRLRK